MAPSASQRPPRTIKATTVKKDHICQPSNLTGSRCRLAVGDKGG
jgi:hypothetical protein